MFDIPGMSKGSRLLHLDSSSPSHTLTAKNEHQLFELEPRTPELVIQSKDQNCSVNVLGFVFLCLDIFVHWDVEYDSEKCLPQL